ncbi:MAG: hypothetical protein ABFR95_05620 [Actinomycetota bacterium]
MKQVRNSRWLRALAAVATLSALLVAGTVAVGTANTVLPDADTIVLELGDAGNQFVYGSATQAIEVGKAECSVTTDSLTGPIMNLQATTIDKHGNPVDPAPIGLVEDGLGVNATGRGNGQDCGRVDELGDGTSETLMLTLGEGVSGRLIESAMFDFEAKFDASVQIEFLLGGSVLFTEVYDLNDGSDSGPDSKFLDKYQVPAPKIPENQGVLFDGVRISAISGGVSLEGGATWPDPTTNRTVFNLQEALACGESADEGGPDLTDNPLAAFYVGPHKTGTDCAVPVVIETDNTSGSEQTVIVAPPAGFDWTGVTGVVTIEWDIEVLTLDGVGRTEQRTFDSGGVPSDAVIPWCEQVVGIAHGSDWYYVLSPDALYPSATGGGDVCLIKQTTETVELDLDLSETIEADEIFTQTTEVYYIWNDPMWVRK